MPRCPQSCLIHHFQIISHSEKTQAYFHLHNNNSHTHTMPLNLNAQKLRILLIGTTAIYFLYFLGGLLQQRIMKLPYENRMTGEKQYFTNSDAFILFPSLFSWGIGWLWNRCCGNGKQNLSGKMEKIPEKLWLKSSILIVTGALAMTKAIYLTNYPLVTLFKSCNLLSVIAVGLFCSRVKEKSQKLEKRQLWIGFVVTLGVLLYQFGGMIGGGADGGQVQVQAEAQVQVQKGDEKGISYMGIGLLVFSLFCDGLIPDFQAQIKTVYKPTPLQMFQHQNRTKSYLILTLSLLSLSLPQTLSFLSSHPLCLLHLLTLSLTGSIGQIFIFWLISHFRQHIVPFLITTRKIFTVVISIGYFGHRVSLGQGIGVGVVGGAVVWEFWREIRGEGKKGEGKGKGEKEDKGVLIVNEEKVELKAVGNEKIESVDEEQSLKTTPGPNNESANPENTLKTSQI